MSVPPDYQVLSLGPAARFQEDVTYLSKSGGKNPLATAKWSSLIGIITAIVGNILISFALNTQRYAHVQLEKERHANERAYHEGKKQSANGNYGTVPENLNEDRSRKSVASSSEHPAGAKRQNSIEISENHEGSPLIPHVSPSSSENATNMDSGEDDQDIERKSYLKSPYWWIGIILMTVGEAGNFLAYGFAPASIVSPLGVVAIISNCLIAPIMLKERFRLRDLLGVIIAVGGAVTVVLSAKTSNPKLGPRQIWSLISRWEFEAYLGLTVAAIITLMIASNKYGQKTIAIDLGLVGLFGGYTALSTKGVASLLSYGFWNAPTYPITYLLIGVLVGTAVMQIKYINRALQRFDSTQVIPTQFVCFTIFVIIGSAVLYRDFEETTGAQAIKFVGGCALTFMGVWCITSGRDHIDEDDVISLDEEDAIDLVDEELEERAAALKTSTSPPSTPKVHRDSIREGSYQQAPLVFDSPSSFATAPQTPHRPVKELQNTNSSPQIHSPIKASSSSLRPSQRPIQSPLPPNLESGDTSLIPHQNLSDTMLSPAAHTLLRTPKTSKNPDGTMTTLRNSNSTPRSISRQSITAGLRPGPLTAPLSSSLSGLVAYTLKRRLGSSAGSFSNGDGGMRGNVPSLRRKSSGGRGLKRRSMLGMSMPNADTTGGLDEVAVEDTGGSGSAAAFATSRGG